MTEPTLLIVGRKRGRPRASEPRSTVSAWLPASEHDRLIRLANKHEMSVSEFVGKVLMREIGTRLEPSR